MFNPLSKKGQRLRAEKREQNRIIGIVKDTILPVLMADSENILDLTRIIEGVQVAVENNLNVKVVNFKNELKEKRFGDLDVKPWPGKREKTEAKIMELLKDEPLSVVDEIITRFPKVVEACVQKELMARKPDTLTIEL